MIVPVVMNLYITPGGKNLLHITDFENEVGKALVKIFTDTPKYMTWDYKNSDGKISIDGLLISTDERFDVGPEFYENFVSLSKGECHEFGLPLLKRVDVNTIDDMEVRGMISASYINAEMYHYIKMLYNKKESEVLC